MGKTSGSTQGNLRDNVTENDSKRQESVDSTIESSGKLNLDPNSVVGGGSTQESTQQNTSASSAQDARRQAAMEQMARVKRMKEAAGVSRETTRIPTEEDLLEMVAEEDKQLEAERAADESAEAAARAKLNPSTIPVQEPQGSGQSASDSDRFEGILTMLLSDLDVMEDPVSEPSTTIVDNGRTVDVETGEILDEAQAPAPKAKKQRKPAQKKSKLGKSLEGLLADNDAKYVNPISEGIANSALREGFHPEQINPEKFDTRLFGYETSRRLPIESYTTTPEEIAENGYQAALEAAREIADRKAKAAAEKASEAVNAAVDEEVADTEAVEEEPSEVAGDIADEVLDPLHQPGERYGEPIKKGKQQIPDPKDTRSEEERLNDAYNKEETVARIEDAIYDAATGEYVNKRKAKRLEQEDNMVKNFLKRMLGGAFPLSGDTSYTEKGEDFPVPSDNVQLAIANFCKFFGANPDHPWTQKAVYNTVTNHLSAAPDMNGKLFGQDLSENPAMPDEVFIWALRDIMQNVMHGEHPHAYHGSGLTVGGTEAIPNPLLTSVEVAFYENFYSGDSEHAQRLRDLDMSFTKEQLVKESIRLWNEEIHPVLLQKSPAQRKAIEAYVRFVAEKCYATIPLHELHLHSTEDITIWEINEDFENEEGEKFGPHVKNEREFVKAMTRRVLEDQQKSRSASAFKGGKFGAAVDKAEDAGLVFIHNAANVRAVTSVALDPFLIGANAVEAAVGNFELGLGNKARMALFTEEERKNFAPTTASLAFCEDAAAREVMNAAEAVRFVAGAEAQAKFLISQRDMGKVQVTVQDAVRWLEENYGNSPSGKITNKLNEMSRKVYSLQSGDWLTRGSDAKLFVQNYLINQRNLAKNGATAITAQQLEGSFMRDPAATMLDMMCSLEGQQAYWLMRGRTLGGAFIASERYNKFARHHPLMGDLTRFFLSTFPEFSIKAVTKINPLMHTTAWLSTAAGASWKDSMTMGEALQKGGSAKMGEQQYAMLLASNDIRECLLLDLMKCGSILSKTLVVGALFMALGGIEEPEDEEDKGLWDMYRIGCEYDENGDPIPGTGFNFRQMWYLNDLLGFAGPAAVAASVAAKTHDVGEATNVMIDGMEDVYFDLAPGKIADFLLGWSEDYDNMRLAAYGQQSDDYDDWAVRPDDVFDFMTTKLMIGSVDLLTDSTTIRFVESLFAGGVNSESYAPDIFHVYTQDPDDDPTNTTSITDYTELKMRQLGSQNVLAGVLFNLFDGVYWQSREEDKTGYTKYDMPYMKTTDIVQKVHWEATRGIEMTIDPDTGQKTISTDDETVVEKINYIYNLLDQVDDAQTAKERGFCFDSAARYAAISYAYYQIGLLKDEKSIKLASAGVYGSDYQAYKLEVEAEYESAAARWNKYVNCLKDWDIPDYPQQYYLWETNLQAYYKNEDGSDSGRLRYTMRNLPLIKQLADASGIPSQDVEYENYGDYDNPMQFLASTSENLDQTWNAETRLCWQGETTNADEVLRDIEGALMTSGNDKGELVSDIITGYGQNTGDFVLGKRAYVPVDQSLRMDYEIDPYNDDFWMPSDATKPSSYQTDSSGYSNGSAYYNSGSGGYSSGYSYSSSSGSSYKPKIYYTSRSVSADKAASMYAKTPYTASTTYLRPAFYTKGSREAYRRQDM